MLFISSVVLLQVQKTFANNWRRPLQNYQALFIIYVFNPGISLKFSDDDNHDVKSQGLHSVLPGQLGTWQPTDEYH